MSTVERASRQGNNRAPRLKAPERRRLSDHAYVAIRSSIVAGRFAMGEHLIETELSEELGMSRAPIREALQRLATEGLVEERTHHGSFVATLGATNVCDLYNVRVGLEITALRLFMKLEAPTRPLWTHISQMERAAKRNDMPKVVQAEFDFHRHIAICSRNLVVRRWFSDLEGPLMLVMAMDDAMFDDIDEIPSEHVPVVAAIESGDERTAVRVFHEHIMSTVGDLIDRLEGDRTALLLPVDRDR